MSPINCVQLLSLNPNISPVRWLKESEVKLYEIAEHIYQKIYNPVFIDDRDCHAGTQRGESADRC